MGQKINERTEVFTSVNGYVTIWSYDPDTETYSPGEKIKVENFLSTGQLDTNGILAWQSMLKMAIATDSLRNLAGANAYTQTANNGVYITSATTTNLPEETNQVGTLEVYNSGTTKYLRYQTYNSGRIEIWTNYYNGTDWGTWDYANGDSSLAFEDGLTESGGVVRMGGSLTDDVEIDLGGFTKTLSGDDSEFIIDFLNTGSGLSTSLIVGSNIVLSVGNYAITIESTGIEFSHVPRYINMRALPSNDAALAVGTSVYYTDADTTNLPATTKTGILECFDHNESGDLQLRYTTYTAGVMQIWGRKKTSGTWAAWAQLSGGSSTATWGEIEGIIEDQTDLIELIPDAQIQSDWNQTDSGELDYIKNKPNNSYQTLTSSASVSMDIVSGQNALITLGHNATITIANLYSGAEGNIVVIQGTSDYTLTISPTPYVINDGAGAVSLQSGSGAITILSYSYDGTNLYINYGKNYTNS